MPGDKTVLQDVLRNFCNVNAFGDGWDDDIRRFLRKDPEREARFKAELDAAIEQGALSAAQYEELTDEDFDTQEDLVPAHRGSDRFMPRL